MFFYYTIPKKRLLYFFPTYRSLFRYPFLFGHLPEEILPLMAPKWAIWKTSLIILAKKVSQIVFLLVARRWERV
jgi:hypothetical protein